LRAAPIGGGTYIAGKHVARQSAARDRGTLSDDEFTTATARLLSG
jgi:hypothetical protein